ncbi:MAG: AraC family transcriptional regulator [Saprospiraceae bacterium]|nr:AraC family transcriptional regulator [Saprospiraceae bacterium]
MPKESNNTKTAYIQRINDVLDFIEKNLDADLSLDKLAKKARYSAFHFHRVFSTVVGENINKFVTRKRIERIGSILLVEKDRSIKELAYTYGFNSESSFSRSFKQFYGVTPTAFKTSGKETLSKIGIALFPLEKYICSIDGTQKWLDMNAQIEVKQLPEIQLLGIMQIGEFEKMGSLFESLMKWGAKKGILNPYGFKAITIYHDNPNVTQLEKTRFSACITVDKEIAGEGAIRSLTIEKGKYVVGRFEIDARDIPAAWQSMLVWVLEHGYRFRDGDYFETYLNDPTTHPEQQFIIEINIPIEGEGKASVEQTPQEISKKQISSCDTLNGEDLAPIDYGQAITYMKTLRLYFKKAYGTLFSYGAIYRANPDFSYFSLTPAALKKLKLKFVIVWDHKASQFTICLSGQNKDIRKKYWHIFKGSHWDKYQVVHSIEKSLSIIDHPILTTANFQNPEALTKQIERESLKFIDDLSEVLK